MKERSDKKDEKRIVSGKKNNPREYLTMSQQQNRYGKGRQRNGSDGEKQERGSNH
jgi:hypothetical protein